MYACVRVSVSMEPTDLIIAMATFIVNASSGAGYADSSGTPDISNVAVIHEGMPS